MPDNEARPLGGPRRAGRATQEPPVDQALPISRLEQQALATEIIDNWFEGKEVLTPILIPVLDSRSKQVLMFSVFENSIAGDPIKISSNLFEKISQDCDTRFIPVQRNSDTRFWLDTLSWIHHARGQLIVTENECYELSEGQISFDETHGQDGPAFVIERKTTSRQFNGPSF